MQPASHRSWLALGLSAGLAALAAAPPAGASASGEISFHRGVIAFDSGQLDQARREFEAALAEEPEDREALRYLAKILEAQGDPATALRLVERARDLDPGDRELALDRAVALVGLGRGTEARGELARVLEEDPGDARARRAAALAQRGSERVVLDGGSADVAVARRPLPSPLGRAAAGFAAAWSLQAETSPLELQRSPGWLDDGGGLHPLQSAMRPGADAALGLAPVGWGLARSLDPVEVARVEGAALPAGLGRSGERRRFGFSQAFLLPPPQPFRSVTLGAARDVLDAAGSAWRYDGFETSLGAGHELPYAVSFSWLWRFAHRDFRDASAFEPFARRVDDTHQLTAELARPIVEHWIARVTGSLRFQDSSVPTYDEQQRAVGASLTYEW